MKKILAVILMMNSLLALGHGGGGGDKVGNGGDVIVCPGSRTELLDLFQGSHDWGFAPQIVSGSRKDTIRHILKDLKQIDPLVAKTLEDRAIEIDREISHIEKAKSTRSKLVKLTANSLVNISDEGVAELPENCEIIQAATQIQKPFPGEVKFTFQKKIWEGLDADVQASLILHEVIYEHMINAGEFSSRSTRYLNAALHAGAINSLEEYFEISSLFGFRNLAIIEDGPVRRFGATGNCKVVRKWADQSEGYTKGGTTVIVNGRNVINSSPDFNQALDMFWKKYVRNGVCD